MFKHLLIASTLFVSSQASVKMCFLKNHADPSTAEMTTLQGSGCEGATVQSLKSQGYSLEDIKMTNASNGFDYIFILKDGASQPTVVMQAPTQSHQATTQAVQQPQGAYFTKEDLRAELQKMDEEKQAKKIEQETVDSTAHGKELYEKKCQSCHKDGTISAYNTARPLKNLTLEDMQESIRDYVVGDKDNGIGLLMRPIASSLIKQDVEDIYNYLQSTK